MIYQVLHETSICRSFEIPTERSGQPQDHQRAVRCGCCGQDGALAEYGYEDQLRQAWADRRGVEIHLFHGQYVVQPRGRTET